jgi:lipopolysaccharide transport protein LptA
MILRFCHVAVFVCLALSTACSKRELPANVDEEWDEIQPLPADAVVIPASGGDVGGEVPQAGSNSVEPSPDVQPAEVDRDFSRRLEAMKAAQRAKGETLLTGTSLVFDYESRFVRMDEHVRVVDDRGELETTSLIGRFSASNEVEYIEAKRGVVIRSEGRSARADTAVYDYKLGQIQLGGQVSMADGESQLSGERIQIWVDGGRKVVCEPNVLLEISSEAGLKLGEVSEERVRTEIRADRLVYTEDSKVAELEGSVRVRDPRAALNCNKLILHVKDDNEIDWIEALSEVIIQLDDRKALAERASYHVDEGKIVLEDGPKVKQGKNIMTGDRILFWHQTRRMVCEPNARVLLYPDEETKAKFLEDLSD